MRPAREAGLKQYRMSGKLAGPPPSPRAGNLPVCSWMCLPVAQAEARAGTLSGPRVINCQAWSA